MFRRSSLALGAVALFLAVGCGGSDSISVDRVAIGVQGRYEKRALGTGGYGSVTEAPTRYAYAQLRSASGVEDETDLDANGQGTLYAPRGASVYVTLVADVAVPASGGGLLMQGSVKKARLATSYASASAFEQVETWKTTSDTVVADAPRNLRLTALESSSEAGAFAIADRMVDFALGMQSLEAGLPLANLHAFWATASGTSTGISNPAPVLDSSNRLLVHSWSKRPMLAHEVRFAGPNDAMRSGDAYNDSLLLETFARSIFAEGSYTSKDGTYGNLVRADNDNAYQDPYQETEPSLAFMSGYASFLSAAFRNDPAMVEVASNGSTTNSWSLATALAPTTGGEFYPAAVAKSMWSLWKNASILGGGTAGLQTTWQATLAQQTGNNEYLSAPLGCFPTYLRGLRRLVASVPDATFRAPLQAQNVGNGLDPLSTGYLSSGALWQVVSLPFSGTGTLRTYADGIYYDRNQARCYRFTYGGSGTLAVTMTPTGGQDFFLELIGPTGIVAADTTQPQGGAPTRSITRSGLPAGDYIVRVRAGYTTSDNTAASYSLGITLQ